MSEAANLCSCALLPQDAQRVLALVKKDMRGCNKELVDAVKALDEALTRQLTRAERENATVYLQVRLTSSRRIGNLQRQLCASAAWLPASGVQSLVRPDTALREGGLLFEQVSQ